MPRDYINIGSSPPEEDCAQLGSPDYYTRAMAEMKRYIKLIRKKMGPEPEGASLAIKSFNHDFGVYHEVVCYYEPGTDGEKYAYACEAKGPGTWDDETPYDWKVEAA